MADPSAPYPSTSYRYPQAPFYPQAPVPYQPPVGPAPGSLGPGSRPARTTDDRIMRAVLGLIRADLESISRLHKLDLLHKVSGVKVDASVIRNAERELKRLEDEAYKGIREDRRREREARDSLYRAFDRARRFAYLFRGHQRKTRSEDKAKATLTQRGVTEIAVEHVRNILDFNPSLRTLWENGLVTSVDGVLRAAASRAGGPQPGVVHDSRLDAGHGPDPGHVRDRRPGDGGNPFRRGASDPSLGAGVDPHPSQRWEALYDSRLDAGHGPDPGHVRDRRPGGGSNPFRRGASDPSLGAGHGPDPDADRFREAAEWWSQQAGSRSPIHDHGNEHQWVPEVEPVYTHTSQQRGAGVQPPAWTARAGVPNHTRPVGRRR